MDVLELALVLMVVGIGTYSYGVGLHHMKWRDKW